MSQANIIFMHFIIIVILTIAKDCEEDLQIFYSFIVLQNNEVYYKLPIID